MPNAFVDWVGSSVAGSEAVVAVLELLPLNPDTTETVHVWLILTSIIAGPVLCISLIAAGVYAWSCKARLIVYSSLAVPLFMAVMAVYYKYQLAEHDPLLARSFWNNAEGNVQGYLLSVCLFVLAFATIRQMVRLSSLGKSHNKSRKANA